MLALLKTYIKGLATLLKSSLSDYPMNSINIDNTLDLL